MVETTSNYPEERFYRRFYIGGQFPFGPNLEYYQQLDGIYETRYSQQLLDSLLVGYFLSSRFDSIIGRILLQQEKLPASLLAEKAIQGWRELVLALDRSQEVELNEAIIREKIKVLDYIGIVQLDPNDEVQLTSKARVALEEVIRLVRKAKEKGLPKIDLPSD